MNTIIIGSTLSLLLFFAFFIIGFIIAYLFALYMDNNLTIRAIWEHFTFIRLNWSKVF